MNTDHLSKLLTDSFRELTSTLLTDGPVPSDFIEIVECFNRFKSELGRKEIAIRLGLSVDELATFTGCIADVKKRYSTNPSIDRVSTDRDIAILRMFSWLETIEHRKNEFLLDVNIEPLVSEDSGRKRVRALELVLRNLVGERHGDQQHLSAYLRNAFGDKTVDRWTQVADAENLLSGTTFSELASIFVNKEEFEHHRKLYEVADVLTLLKERRKTVQSFLEDIRRVRNTLAHNKNVSNIQLSLLDLYYEQLIVPVAAAYKRGETQVDPQKFLQVSDTELNTYFDELREDVISIKDDVAELKAELDTHFSSALKQSDRIESTTTGINKKLVAALAILLVAIAGIVYLIYMGLGTKDEIVDLATVTESVNEKSDRLIANTNQLRQSTAEIKDTSENIAKKTDQIQKNTIETNESVKQMAASNERIVQSVEAIQQGFVQLTKSGGVIENATLPQEVYHNARIYEQRGDYGNARKSYIRFFGFNLDLVDPHLRFQTFLKLQEGREGAREIYSRLSDRSASFVTDFAASLLADSNDRVEKLSEFVKQYPQFAPAYYELSREYSETRLGSQDMTDKAAEKKYLEKFLKLKESGNYLKFMLDNELADEQLSDARDRLQALSNINEAALNNPVTLSGMMSNSGWMINVQVAGNPKQILYRIGRQGEFKDLGHMQIKNQQTGFPMPNMTINLDTSAGPTTFDIKYVDARDREHGPYSIDFNPKTEIVKSQKSILNMMPKAWAAFRDYEGETLVYFSHMVSYRMAINEIWYGVDKEIPDTKYKIAVMTPTGVIEHFKELDQGDPAKPGAIGENEMPFFKVPNSTQFLTVQIKYLDGTESEIQRFNR